MTENVATRKRKGEFWIVNLAISLTMIIWGVTMLLYTYSVAPAMALMIFAATVLLSIACLGFGLYWRRKKVNREVEFMDERSDAFSLKASRNAFIIALVFLALYMIIGQMRPDSLYRIQALQGVFGVSVASYIISYFYYQMAG